MKAILFSLFCTSLTLANQVILEDPMVSLRCKELIREREKKVEVKQKLKSLIEKTTILLKKSQDERPTAIGKLASTQSKLKANHKEAVKRIAQMEEHIVRSGCPGIKL